ncbi:MAG: copper ion binding protein [Candidatus Aenigmatarchaeota archaeon]
MELKNERDTEEIKHQQKTEDDKNHIQTRTTPSSSSHLPVRVQKKQFKVSGMKCSGCETIMKSVVAGANGIYNFKVDHSTGWGEIEYDPEKVDLQKVFRAMKEKGYDCFLVEEAEARSTEEKHRTERIDKKKLAIKGMTCKSCEQLIANHVRKIDGVKCIDVNYSKGTANVTYDAERTDAESIINAINEKGYECEECNEDKRSGSGWKTAGTALGFAIVILGAFLIAQSSLISVVPEFGTNASLFLIFTVGLLTGFHCIGMCGGFMVSYTTKNAMDEEKEGIKSGSKLRRLKPNLSYSVGKLISYTVVGAFFGLMGSFFTFTGLMRGIMALVAGALMIIMGLNMLNAFPFLRKINFHGLGFLGKRMAGRHKGPFMLGLFTGLMPCGPLIAMELYAAGTGNVFFGATALFVFGLGTLPIMNGFGAAISMLSMNFTKRILKISALIVIVLGIVMLSRGLTLSGVGFNLNSVSASLTFTSKQNAANLAGEGIQEINMTVNSDGWTPDRFVLKKGVPVRWNIDVKQLTGCNKEIIVPAYNLDIKLKQGLNVVEFTPTSEGVVLWSCWMGMIPGTFVVKENIDLTSQQQVQATLNDVPTPKRSGGCGCGCSSGICGG